MKIKKLLLTAISYVTVAAIAIGGTMAYLTSEDSDVNVMTLGNVKIAQHEYERVVDENGNPVKGVEGTDFNSDYGITESYKLQEFSQAKPAYPAVYKAQAWDDIQQLWNQVGAPGFNELFDDSMKNVIDKFVFVENTGESNAYYRTIIAIECPEGFSEELIHTNMSTDSRFVYDDAFFTKIDGVRYLVYVATYTDVLTPGEVSCPSLLQVFLNPKTTNEDCALLGESWEILVKSQAVQTKGFDSAAEALEAAFGKVTATSHPWSNTVFVEKNDENEFLSAVASGKDAIVVTDIVEVKDKFDGNGSEVTLAGVGDGSYGYLAFAPGKGKGTEVKNLEVTGSGFVEVGHHGQGGGTYVIDNLKVKDMNTTLAVYNGSDKVSAAFAHYGNATLNNCVMTGTTTSVEGWENSVYDVGFVNGTKTIINGGEYGSMYVWNQAHVTINNAKVGKIDTSAITYKNLGKLTIGAGTVVDSITIASATGTFTPALVIEEGATVGSIIYNGATYTQTEWINR